VGFLALMDVLLQKFLCINLDITSDLMVHVSIIAHFKN